MTGFFTEILIWDSDKRLVNIDLKNKIKKKIWLPWHPLPYLKQSAERKDKDNYIF